MSTLIACKFCHKVKEIATKEEDVNAWIGGKLIQDAMPYLSASDREMLISRTCDDCWGEIFSVGDEIDVND